VSWTLELRDCLHSSLPVTERAARAACRIESTRWYALSAAVAGDPWDDDDRDRISLSEITSGLRDASTDDELEFWLGWVREVAANDGVRLMLPERRHLSLA